MANKMRDKIILFKVLSEPNRVRILMMLLIKPLCVCEIASILELTTATVSKHLSYLKKEGFIEDEKDGKWINYRMSKNKQNEIINNLLEYIIKWFKDEEIILKDLKKVANANRYEICLNKITK